MRNNSVIALVVMGLLTMQTAAAPSSEIAKESALYSDLIPHFRRVAERYTELFLLSGRKVNRVYSALLVRAALPADKADPNIPAELRPSACGLFVIDDASNRLHAVVDVFKANTTCDAEIGLLRVTDAYIDVFRWAAKPGAVPDQVRYLLDLPRKKVTRYVPHLGMNIYSMVEFQGALYAIGTSDGETSILTRLRSKQTADQGHEIMNEIAGREMEIVRAARVEGSRLILTSEHNQYILTGRRWAISSNPEAHLFRYNSGSGAPVGVPWVSSFWVPLYLVREQIVPLPSAADPSRRLLIWNQRIAINGGHASDASGIFLISADRRQFYPLPQPTYEIFKQRRPRRVEDGYTEDATTFRVQVGPFQLEGTRLWFGMTFYDGEGTTGVGGIAYFDIEKNAYHITYFKELVDWSTSAISLDDRNIWLGLVRHPEGEDCSAGLLRFDRVTREVRRFEVTEVVNAIQRSQDRLYLGTNDGVFLVTGDRASYFGFEIGSDGRYQLHLKQAPDKAKCKSRS